MQGMTSTTSKKGGLLATALAGAWRQPPPPMAMSAEELGEITPLLLETGGGAPAVLLAWGAGQPGYLRRFGSYLRHPAGVVQAVGMRWPSRIQAAAKWRAPSSKTPARPLQAWAFTVRGARWLAGRA